MTTIAVKITIIAGLAMPVGFSSAFAGGSDPSNTKAISSQSDEALGESDCQAIWSLAVRDDDRLSYDKATPYVTNLQAADPDNDGYVDKTEFMDACQKGLVHSASSSHVMLRKR